MLAATVGILQPLPMTLKVNPDRWLGNGGWTETAKLAQVGAYEDFS